MVVDEDSEMADQQPDPRHDSERDEPESPLLLIQADNVGVATVTSLLKTISFCEVTISVVVKKSVNEHTPHQSCSRQFNVCIYIFSES